MRLKRSGQHWVFRVALTFEKLATKLDRSKNYIITQTIKEFLVRKSIDEKRWSETLEVIDSVKAGKLVKEHEIDKWLDSWGADDELNPPKI